MKRVISVCLVLLLVVPVLAVSAYAAESKPLASDTTGEVFYFERVPDVMYLDNQSFDFLFALFEMGSTLFMYPDPYMLSDGTYRISCTYGDSTLDFGNYDIVFHDLSEGSNLKKQTSIFSFGDIYFCLFYFVFDESVGIGTDIYTFLAFSEQFNEEFVDSALISLERIDSSDSGISLLADGSDVVSNTVSSLFSLISNNPLFSVLFAGALIMTCIPLYVSLRKNSH